MKAHTSSDSSDDMYGAGAELDFRDEVDGSAEMPQFVMTDDFHWMN